jgi:exosortase/archaeosortase family protein
LNAVKRVAKPITTRLALGLAGMIAALLLLEQAPALQPLLEPVNLGLARATEWLIQQLDMPVDRQGAMLMHPDGFSYRITAACSGLRPAVLIGVTLLMVPATWTWRLAGACTALLGIEALNLGRLVHLYWTGVVDPHAFFMAHRVTWNIAAIAAIIGFLAVWLYLSQGRRPGKLPQPARDS